MCKCMTFQNTIFNSTSNNFYNHDIYYLKQLLKLYKLFNICATENLVL